MRVGALAAALVCVGVTAAADAPPLTITPMSVAGANLGLRASAYKRLFGSPVRKDVVRFPKNYTRLVFVKRKVAVYFTARGKAFEITTWNKTDKTAARIGPCSTIKQLKAAYGSRLKRSEPNTLGSRVYAYTVGRLIFAAGGRDPTGPSKHVTAVALYSGALNLAGFFATMVELAAIRC